MNYWQHSLFIKIIAYLTLAVMTLNPALALQYQHYNETADFLSKIPDYQARAYHIHISQKDDVLTLLKKQGYDVIPASVTDARHFLNTNPFSINKPLQLAANFNLKRVYQDECSHTRVYCSRGECDKYPKQRRKDCRNIQAIARSSNSAIEHPPEDNCNTTALGKDCPAECIDDDQSNNKNCPQECLTNPCTDTDPVERARDKGPVSKPRESRPAPRGRASVYIDQGFRLPKISGGGNGKDAAAVMLIVIGVVVIAALFIYAGKWIADMLQNDEDYYAYWWDIGGQFINLDTDPGEHGNFTGIKFSGGFVPNMHTNFGLTAEIGRMDLDLLYNRNSTPQRVNIEGTYWLLGPIVRWLFGNRDSDENFAHNSYVYLELLGGNSDRDGIDMIGVGRIGINTGLGEHMRLGFHYGAFYLGLDEDQGFANDGDNYWNMYGLEIGYQF